MSATVASIAALVDGATHRRSVRPEDARSGATFEHLELGGRRCFLKVLALEADWVMRVTGNTDHWEHKVWRAGIYDRLPATIDHTIIAMALDETGPTPQLGILMHDCSDDLIPPGDEAVDIAAHEGFIRSMATLHAELWGWTDSLALCPMVNRLRFFAPETIAPELAAYDVPPPVAAADAGWAALADRSPRLLELLRTVQRTPEPLLRRLAETPVTFLSGDWKMGNLGRRPDGRTILLDQAYPGSGPACWDLLWYLALNRQRLPESKDATIARYRVELEGAGVDVADWWSRQLSLCELALMACFGWEKALGDDDELSWWAERALAAAELLG